MTLLLIPALSHCASTPVQCDYRRAWSLRLYTCCPNDKGAVSLVSGLRLAL